MTRTLSQLLQLHSYKATTTRKFNKLTESQSQLTIAPGLPPRVGYTSQRETSVMAGEETTALPWPSRVLDFYECRRRRHHRSMTYFA